MGHYQISDYIRNYQKDRGIKGEEEEIPGANQREIEKL